MKKVEYLDVLEHGKHYFNDELMDVRVTCPECKHSAGGTYSATELFDFVQKESYVYTVTCKYCGCIFKIHVKYV